MKVLWVLFWVLIAVAVFSFVMAGFAAGHSAAFDRSCVESGGVPIENVCLDPSVVLGE